ncbi:uncharacterized protein LOC9322003 [Arabidopsis lyrata subsp. lyrata]|uniref:uncharacterized protein LOC9322003 n=1 Tax=Arabidopsis lyrata subsp. lyrata TaxID=81972 RepID=UPI000A29BD12|nr:uncharacterized protein LOC9322003 [Arabidopsis lyrata subsp. lyrata]XP_020886329.1 uncharacterized protein LOC9322003 [Arabidopsis lyrata subsp. lyrata]XP_020886330.1 uncharacterized protein LOC9322003 [Arabidopsis lyrata subsp. lyrata]XP_020886331.1 uncharacterized protein LOC9322003 [Arabidopsis lyrata subsp. lyrata]|eukprot:XP_020886328.1 uncharacterized protein LOC9322003 [Arabidopsis lyrata subsp. lyrata]
MVREWGSKHVGGRGAASGQNNAIDQIESYECKICLKVHNNERDYLSHLHAHFQEKKFRDEMKTENTSDNDLYDSEFSEPPDLSKWFPDYVYESPMLDTCYGFEFSDLKESESIKDLEIKKETPTKIDDLVSSKIDDMTDSQAAYSGEQIYDGAGHFDCCVSFIDLIS